MKVLKYMKMELSNTTNMELLQASFDDESIEGSLPSNLFLVSNESYTRQQVTHINLIQTLPRNVL